MLEDKISPYLKNEIRFENSDISINIKEIHLEYLGKPEGFYTFRDSYKLFRVGFKDRETNKGLHDIKIQLEAYGIYTLGLKPLLEYIESNILKGITTGHYPVTRADLNIFVNMDLNPFMDKECFSTRKRRFLDHSKVIENPKDKESFYIGKSPFMLRIYNKLKELNKQSKDKKEVMLNHFQANGDLDISKPIYNVEFELHRAYLKRFAIDTIEHLLDSAKTIFSECLYEIRLIDLGSISKNDLNNGHKYRAKTHRLWEHIAEAYTLKDYLSIDAPLERIKRKQTEYIIDQAFIEFMKLMNKAMSYRLHIGIEFFKELLYVTQATSSHKKENSNGTEPYQVIAFYAKDGSVDTFRLINGELIKPITVKYLTLISLSELYNYKLKLEDELDNPFNDKEKMEEINNRLYIVEMEFRRRG
eukprot:TRINITY_DN120456_c0_g1_i1.p1 TRINITY_DN120456_c0_g1~~TRINITY_DN120456_c0_g1_i1.p1  ORF type:complete len:440 (-),score=30.23 TRINITY_DN120456_c0_g1_i1:1314-2561(-)